MTEEFGYFIWQGDTGQLQVELSDKNGLVDLSTATSITAIIEEFSGSPHYDVACTGDALGVATIPLSTVTVSHGRFKYRVTVVFGSEVHTWPSEGPEYMKILDAF